MKKLALNLDDLTVESFETAPDASLRGTILAHVTTGDQVICECSYDVGSCDHTCAHSCYGGCGGGTGLCTRDRTCATGDQIICECGG